jgi:hypothetical protein
MQIPTFPTLYFLKDNGKIYEWSILIEETPHHTSKSPQTYKIITFHGEKEGKKVKHSRDIDEGKAKRTALEQAIQEAKKKWDNKGKRSVNIGNNPYFQTRAKTTLGQVPILFAEMPPTKFQITVRPKILKMESLAPKQRRRKRAKPT